MGLILRTPKINKNLFKNLGILMIKNRLKDEVNMGRHLGIDLLIDFGGFGEPSWVENRSNIDPNRHRKNDENMKGIPYFFLFYLFSL